MQGNPCSKDADYHTRVIAHLAQRYDQPKVAHLSDVVYVDYKLVDPEKVQLAKEQWQDELYEQQENEKKKSDDASKEAELREKEAELAAANLTGVDTLLKVMLGEDPEHHRYVFCVHVCSNTKIKYACDVRIYYISKTMFSTHLLIYFY